MAKFEVTLVSSNGRTSKLVVEGGSKADVERQLRRKGRILGIKKKFALDLAPGMSPAERYTFLIRMSSMLGAKLGAAEALRLVIATFGGNIRRASKTLLARVESGMDLPVAMEHDRKNFPAAMVALIKAGTGTGETWRALKGAAEFEYQMQSIRKGSGKEMIQAFISFLIAGAITIVSTQYMGPKVLNSDMFKHNKDVDIGWVVQASNVVTVMMGILLVIMLILVWLATAGRQIMPVTADTIILKIPFYKDIVLSRNNYAVLYKLSLLIRSGVRIEESLSLTHDGAPRGAMKNDIAKALKAVRSGKPWAVVMEKTLHPTDRAALACATNREDIAQTLDILAAQYRDLYVQRMATFAPAMQMVSAIFMTIAGGVMFGMTILPMLQMSKGVSSM